MEKENTFLDVIHNMQNEINTELKAIELILVLENKIILKEDKVTVTKDGFISINDLAMHNLNFIQGAILVEFEEEPEFG